MKNFYSILISFFLVSSLNAQCPTDIQPSCPIITGAFLDQSDNGDGTSDYTVTIEWIQGTADNASLQWDVYAGSIICPEEYDDLGLYPEENCQPVNSENSSGTIIDYLNNVDNTQTVYLVAQGRTNESCGGNKCNQTLIEVAPRPVPVKLVSFEGKQVQDQVLLNWTTESEVQNEGFIIEWSENAVDFEELDFVAGHGTTTETKNYVYRNDLLMFTTTYYRLKQIDYDGGFAYSEIIRIDQRNVTGSASDFSIYPNPNKTGLLNVELEDFENSSLEILDNFGKRVLFQNLKNHNTQINIDHWPSGIYNVVIFNNSIVKTQRLVKSN